MIEDLFGSEPYHVLLAAIGLALLLAYGAEGRLDLTDGVAKLR